MEKFLDCLTEIQGRVESCTYDGGRIQFIFRQDDERKIMNVIPGCKPILDWMMNLEKGNTFKLKGYVSETRSDTLKITDISYF